MVITTEDNIQYKTKSTDVHTYYGQHKKAIWQPLRTYIISLLQLIAS